MAKQLTIQTKATSSGHRRTIIKRVVDEAGPESLLDTASKRGLEHAAGLIEKRIAERDLGILRSTIDLVEAGPRLVGAHIRQAASHGVLRGCGRPTRDQQDALIATSSRSEANIRADIDACSVPSRSPERTPSKGTRDVSVTLE